MSQEHASSSPKDIQLEVLRVPVKDLLSDTNLTIPEYQRPYKWTQKNIIQLFTDIATFKDKLAYRLGTIVLYKKNEKHEIVDGQQRIITLLLTVQALFELRASELERSDFKVSLCDFKKNMEKFRFTSEISKANLRANYGEICRLIERADFTEEHINFLLNKCEVVVVTLTELSEAFQFFDSQNARGRELEPHDLLKAYHLRAFSPKDESFKKSAVAAWENCETPKLAALFSQYLYRIRNWSNGKSARYFRKKDVGLFKGVNLDNSRYPYAEQFHMLHHFVDCYNQQYERIDGHFLGFPFQLNQTVINGWRFFEMIAHYQKMVEENTQANFVRQFVEKDKYPGYAKEILSAIDEYEGRYRTGDRYVRMMFDCLLIYYIDKFGYTEISRAVEKIFIWAYSLRLNRATLQLASADNYAVWGCNLFKLLKEAIQPSDFLSYSLPVVPKNCSTGTEKIEDLFQKMKYIKGGDTNVQS